MAKRAAATKDVRARPKDVPRKRGESGIQVGLTPQAGPRQKAKPTPLLEFGRFIKELREASGFPTQAKFAKALGRSQSYVALLETGGVTNPDLALLTELVNTLNSGNAAARPDTRRSGMPTTTVEALIAALITSKYEIPLSHSSLLTMEVRDRSELACWERDMVAKELWIIAPNFMDNRDPEIRGALAHRLESGTTVSFFVRESDATPGGQFLNLRLQLSRDLAEVRDWEQRLRHYSLGDDEMAWISSSFVIRNPQEVIRWGHSVGALPTPETAQSLESNGMSSASSQAPDAEGYTIISRDNDPAYGFRMSSEELLARTFGVYRWLSRAKSAPVAPKA